MPFFVILTLRFFIKKYSLGKTRAQSTLEYAVVVACVAAALLAMQIYLKRGIQGKLRQAGDEIGEQYAPLNVESQITTETTSNTAINQSLVPLLQADGYNPLLDQYGLPVYGMQTTSDINETTAKINNPDGTSAYEKLGAFENGLF